MKLEMIYALSIGVKSYDEFASRIAEQMYGIPTTVESSSITDELILVTKLYVKDIATKLLQEAVADGWVQVETYDRWRNTIDHRLSSDLILTTDELYDMYFKKGGTEMTQEEAKEILHTHNQWRRGAEIEPTNPTTLGQAIDVITGQVSDNSGQSEVNDDSMNWEINDSIPIPECFKKDFEDKMDSGTNQIDLTKEMVKAIRELSLEKNKIQEEYDDNMYKLLFEGDSGTTQLSEDSGQSVTDCNQPVNDCHELKPCPFCGSDVNLVMQNYAHCNTCGLSVNLSIWNKRSYPKCQDEPDKTVTEREK